MNTSNSSPLSSGYGLHEHKIEEVLKDADRFGVTRAAALHNLPARTIYNWKKALENAKHK